jgi:hypothetical protein
MNDPWPRLVREAVVRNGESNELLRAFSEHVVRMARPYPDAYFALGRKSPDAFTDLAHRAYASCARQPKGRFPFAGREPFRAFVEEDFDGRTMRYHAVYSRLSIARELLRDDYARNVRRDPVLQWRANVFRDVGEALRAHAVALPGPKPVRWTLPDAGPAILRAPEVVVARLRPFAQEPFDALCVRVLRELGAAPRGAVAQVMCELLTPPASDVASEPTVEDDDVERTVRAAVRAAWEALDPDARALITALARGDAYDDVIARSPSLNNRVAVSRAVGRLAAEFVRSIETAVGAPGSSGRPKQIVELVLDVLLQTEALSDAEVSP